MGDSCGSRRGRTRNWWGTIGEFLANIGEMCVYVVENSGLINRELAGKIENYWGTVVWESRDERSERASAARERAERLTLGKPYPLCEDPCLGNLHRVYRE